MLLTALTVFSDGIRILSKELIFRLVFELLSAVGCLQSSKPNQEGADAKPAPKAATLLHIAVCDCL